MKKISPVGVFNGTLKLLWQHKWTVLLYCVVLAAITAALYGIDYLFPTIHPDSLAPDPLDIAHFIGFAVLSLTLFQAWTLSLQYHFIAIQVGKKKYIPQKLAIKSLQGAGYLFVNAFIINMLTSPVAFLGMTLLPYMNENHVFQSIMENPLPGFLCLGGWLVIIGLLFVRLNLVFPALAVGKRSGLVNAWDLSRGHTFRIFASAIIFPFPVMLLSFIPMFFPDNTSYFTVIVIGLAISMVMVTAFWPILFATWYKELMARRKAMDLEQGQQKEDTSPIIPIATKVTTAEAAAQAWALFKDRKWTYMGICSATTLLIALLYLWKAGTDPALSTGTQYPRLPVIILCIIAPAFKIFFSHFAVTHQRGRAKLIPPRPFEKIIHALVIMMVPEILVVLVVVPSMIFSAEGSPIHFTNAITGEVTPIATLLVTLLVCAIMSRFMLAFPGIAMGEVIKIRDIWRLSKGYGIILFIVCFVQSLPDLGMNVLVDHAKTSGTMMFAFVMSIVLAPVLALAMLMLSVWYEHLVPPERKDTEKPHFKLETLEQDA